MAESIHKGHPRPEAGLIGPTSLFLGHGMNSLLRSRLMGILESGFTCISDVCRGQTTLCRVQLWLSLPGSPGPASRIQTFALR